MTPELQAIIARHEARLKSCGDKLMNAERDLSVVLGVLAWRPIETAPKDGSRVIIWDGAPYIAKWAEEANDYQFTSYPGWQIFDCDDGFYSIASKSPTHWMPLPADPVDPGQ